MNTYLATVAAIALVFGFAIATPAFAQYTYDPVVSAGSDYTYDPVVSAGSDYTYDPVVSAGSDYTYNPVSTVSSGSYSVGPTYSSVAPVYYTSGGSVVTSGGFSGGTAYAIAPVYYTYGSTVTTGGFSGGSTTYYPNGTLSGTCSAGVSNTAVGGTVTWTASASGGNGFYNFYWTGDEGLSASGQAVSKIYSYSGVKNATVTITSTDGQSITRTCSVNVGVGNQVLAYSATNPGLQSVYLSQVPYTGAGDVARVVGFLLLLVAWSAGLAYVFLKRKANGEAVAVAAETAASDTASLVSANTDERALDDIAEHARANKVLLSSDALVELAKRARLGRTDAKKAIAKMSGGDWTAIGEADIEKYL